MGVLPVPVVPRQIPPGTSRAQYPENCVDKAPVISRSPSPLSLLPRKMRLKQLPGSLFYVVSPVCGRLFQLF
jgi:hypothetical protein